MSLFAESIHLDSGYRLGVIGVDDAASMIALIALSAASDSVSSKLVLLSEDMQIDEWRFYL